MLTARYAALGRWVARHPWPVVIGWLLALVIASLGSTRLAGILSGGGGVVPGSPSERMEQLLRREFANPFTHVVAVTVHSAAHPLGDPHMEGLARELRTSVQALPEVARVLGPGDPAPVALRSEAGDRWILLLGLKASTATQALNMVPAIRRAVGAVARPARDADPSLKVYVTGLPAVTYDLNYYSSEDTSRAEGRLFPLTVLILLLGFGGLVAAGIPLVVGMASVVLTLGLCWIIGQGMELSLYVQNLASMIGLAVGIDYSLLMVYRFRAAQSRHPDVAGALAETLATAGVAVTYSGLTVLIGLGAMALTPLLDTRSMGLGGSLVVVVSVLLALTLLPALLALVAPWLDAPRRLSRQLLLAGHEDQWRRWVRLVVARPWIMGLGSLVAIAALAAPLARLEIGYPDTRLFPDYMESVHGVEELNRMELSGFTIPIFAVVRDPAGPVLRAQNLPALMRFSSELRRDPLIRAIASPVDLPGVSPLQVLMLYQDPAAALARFPLIQELFVSRDQTRVLFQIIPYRSADLPQLRELAAKLATRELPGGLELSIGGTPTYYNDHEGSIVGSFPYVGGFIVLTTLAVMALAFRSYLVPLKAVLMNLMSVAAGYGAVVAVFQLGWARPLVGLAPGAEAMPVPVLVLFMLFCVVFGLSMDYEVFLISAIKEEFDRCGDNSQAVVEGIARTSRLIFSAALIMVAIFGAFAWADFVIVKMLGLGLAVAVLVDATLIRLVLLPAFMQLMGRANWYPGVRATPAASPEEVAAKP